MKRQAITNLVETASELAESWVNGNRNFVIKALESGHPCLTAMLLVHLGPLGDEILDESDCQGIANRLIDARVRRYI